MPGMNDSYIHTGTHALFILTDNKISFERDIIQFFEYSSF